MRLSSSAAAPDATSSSQAVPILNIDPLQAGGGGGGNEAARSSTPGEEKTSVLSALPGSAPRSLAQRKVDPALRSPEDLSVLEVGSDSMVIGWTAPPEEAGPCSFEVEMRGVLVDAASGRMESVWVVYPVAKQDRIDRLVKAKIEKLKPASTYEFRVILATEDGRSSEPSVALSAETALPMDWTYIYLSIGLGLIVLLGFGVWKVIRDRRPEVYQAQYVDV